MFFWRAAALATALLPAAGIFAAVVASSVGSVAVDVVGKKLEDMAKEKLPSAIEAGRQKIGTMWYGGGSNPTVVLNRPITDKTLEDTIQNIKNNSALIQDLLNKLAGKAGNPHFCDDVYQIAVLAEKLDFTKAEITRDITVLRQFLDQLGTDLGLIDSADINLKVKALAEAICTINDGRHWDNTWHTSTVGRNSHCSKQHCYGPR